MAEGRRPGGLTALAVLNFILCGFGFFGIIGLIGLFAIFSATNLGPEMQAIKDAFEDASLGMGYLTLSTIIAFITFVLLLLSGIGYLIQKKFLGRTVGNVYALISIVSSLMTVLWLPASAGGGFSLSTVLGLIYPVLTAILINTTFRKDLVR